MKTTGMCLTVALLSAAGCGGPRVWIDSSETVTIAAADLKTIDIETHNGDIQLIGSVDASQIEAVITARYGGWNLESAQNCKDAVELVSETVADGRHRLVPRWRRAKASDWQANVSYKVVVPARLASSLTSHNGDIAVKDVAGACKVVTHNGDVSIVAHSPALRVLTHNGDIHAKSAAIEMNLDSHNGSIHIDSSGSSRLSGRIATHNGAIIAKLDDSVSTELACRTHNGRIKSDLPWRVKEMSKYEVVGTLGEGAGRLEVESFNGNISLVK